MRIVLHANFTVFMIGHFHFLLNKYGNVPMILLFIIFLYSGNPKSQVLNR